MSSALANSLRTGSSRSRGVPTATAVAINSSGQTLAPALEGARQVVTGGAIVAAAAATVVVRSGGASGAILLTLPLAEGAAIPLSIFALFSEVGEELYIATADGVAITGRVLTEVA